MRKIDQVAGLRGRKQLAKALKRCWLDLGANQSDSFVDCFVGNIQIHAPLEEYEFFRNLPSPDREALLKILNEVYSSADVAIVDISCVLEIDDQIPDQLVAAIEEQKSLMISVGTGERRIQDANDEYKKRRGEISKMLQTKSIKDPNPFFDLWGWYKRFKSGDLPTYASRRQFMSELYDPLLERLQRDGSSTFVFDEPTGWTKVDRAVTELRQRLEQATTEEQYQAVGTLCREALISLAQVVFDPTRHPTSDGVKASATDFKRMIEAYIAVELAGTSREASRRHAKAAFDLANDLQHKRTADFRHAALCSEATVAVVNLIAVVSGRRDP